MKLPNDLREFIALLNSRKVDYVVVGGHAVAFHGHPRFTNDLDFLVRPERQNAERLLAVLDEFGFGELPLSVQDFERPGMVVQLGRSPNRIDLLTAISGVSFDAAWQSRVTGQLDGLPVCFLGLEALLLNKDASGRAMDAADAEILRAIANQAKRKP